MLVFRGGPTLGQNIQNTSESVREFREGENFEVSRLKSTDF